MRLDAESERICKAVTLELEARSAILAVSLNDAIEERGSENPEITSSLLELTASEWDRLAEDVMAILEVISNNLPLAPVTLPVRNIVPSHFKSDVMMDYVRLHEWVDQFLFRTKLRFNLQVRVLRHAVETLSSDFRQAQPLLQPAQGASGLLWDRLDRDFHDFDLISKETLLALRNLVGCLPEDAIADIAAQLQPLLQQGVRSADTEKRPGRLRL
ncbi:MAG TPA: hypothetical protein VL523_11955 [Terriglobia bacterium]|nr:hypothetical protein [Terriglobia bacterium]